MIHYFECNLRILENFHITTQNLRILAIPFQKNLVFWGFFNKDYNFNINNVFFTMKDAQTFLKISFLVTFLHFQV